MNAIELARKVYETRNAQRKYFKVRSMNNLAECKRLEKELDRILAEIITDREMPLIGLSENNA